MQITFWGVRGSTPTPDPGSLRYGGNTPCVEIRTPEGHIIIVDAGTGIIRLGKRMVRDAAPGGIRAALLLSHFHWDHIQGLPFFLPLYQPGNEIRVFAPATGGVGPSHVLDSLMRAPYFPVDPGAMKSRARFSILGEQRLKLWDVEVSTRALNHPQGCLGFRVEGGGGVFTYASDHEHGQACFDDNVRELAEGADVLVYDAQYTPEEYASRTGWGHSTWVEAVRAARDAGARRLVLFHHDPDHSDAFLDAVLAQASARFPNVVVAAEGSCIRVAAAREFKRKAPARATSALPEGVPAVASL